MLVMILGITLTAQAQQQERHRYATVSLTEGDKVETRQDDCTIYVNYENKPVIKLLFSSGGVMYYDSISDVAEGVTNGGMQYWYGRYQERGTKNTMLVQLFKDDSYGIRFIDSQGNMIQFY